MAEFERNDGEAGVVARSSSPLTVAEVRRALIGAGVANGAVVIVHSSLSRLGWAVGGAQSVVMALVDVVGVEGTIVMPAQTGVSDPANWRNPPVPQAWWPTIRSDWPAFDPFVTPLRGMGAVVECFQHLPDVLHCGHPATGFVARGPLAASIVASHPLEESLGDLSPLGRLYDADARVVLIGVGHANNTSLHLAEHRAEYPGKAMKAEGAPLMVDGVRRWVTYMDLDRDEEDFVALGDAFLASGGSEEQASLGYGRVITYSMRDIVDFGTRWLTETRSKLAGFGP